ncbi:heterokaryon incompatibility protein-domain-containing protein [Xylariaceae sp. FL1272]|nr:heterokaryon incompatibility protein-domain-containing protein [Xylariaceae sp. FL1272]
MGPRQKRSEKRGANHLDARRRLFTGRRLCWKCFQVPWEQFYDPEAFPRPSTTGKPGFLPRGSKYPLGSVTSVLRKARYCVSCKFALYTLRQRYDKDIYLGAPGIIRYYVRDPWFNHPILHRKLHPGHHVRERMNMLEVRILEQEYEHPRHRRCQEFLIGKPPELEGSPYHSGPASFTARNRPQVASIPLLNTWMKECDYESKNLSDHALDCAPRQFQLCEGLFMKLVDVVKGCVLVLPPMQPPPRYVALSYVWGSTKQVHLTRSNITILQTDNSLWEQSLPQTFVDAMHLVSQLGERYLWIDALCIIQDDMKELRAFISRMDLIYGGAILTIIAAAGVDASAGLPGLRAQTRKLAPSMIPLGPFRFCLPIFNFEGPEEHYLAGTRWTTRGWTFQEGVLSRRKLIFTDDQIYWSCSRFTRCEQINFEGTWFFAELSRDLEVDFRTEFQQPLIPDTTFGAGEILPYIRKFSTTSLRARGDRLDAFKGVLSFIGTMHNGQYFAALPINGFMQALLWDIEEERVVPEREGAESSNYPDVKPPVRRFPFPSWSWLAWSGKVRFHKSWLPAFNTPPDHFRVVKSLVTLFVLREGKLVPLINTTESESSLATHHKPPSALLDSGTLSSDSKITASYNSTDDNPDFEFLDHDGSSDVLRDGRLFFWAESVVLEFDNKNMITQSGIFIWMSTDYDYVRSREFIAIAQTYDNVVLMNITRDKDGIAFREAIAYLLAKDWYSIPDKKHEWIVLA